MQNVLLFLAMIGCLIGYIVLLFRMRREGVGNPPIIPMFFLFGTVGGWLLVFGSPYGLAALFTVFLFVVSPIVLLASSYWLQLKEERSIYHRISIWSGFWYPALLGLAVAAVAVADFLIQ